MSYAAAEQGLGWVGAIAMEGQPVLVELPIEQWAAISAASIYSYMKPSLLPALIQDLRVGLIDYGLEQARKDAARAKTEAVLGSALLLASIWGAAWWIKRGGR